MEPEYTLPVHPIVAGLAARVIGKKDLRVALEHATTAREYKDQSGRVQVSRMATEHACGPRAGKRAGARPSKVEQVSSGEQDLGVEQDSGVEQDLGVEQDSGVEQDLGVEQD